MTTTSAFKTPEGEAAFLAAYEAAWSLFPDVHPCLDQLSQHRLVEFNANPEAMDFASWPRFCHRNRTAVIKN